jgi:hypothetical protein
VELLVKASSSKTMPIQQFRDAVYQSVLKRADTFFNLLDALIVAGHVNSPVTLSEEALSLDTRQHLWNIAARYQCQLLA